MYTDCTNITNRHMDHSCLILDLYIYTTKLEITFVCVFFIKCSYGLVIENYRFK